MIQNLSMRRTIRRLGFAGAAVAALAVAATSAMAGECPADKRGVDLTKPGATSPEGVTDEVLSAVDLGKEAVMLNDRMLRLRKLVVQPGGVVPWHSHADRPAIIYIISGEITEYASTCAVPIVHKVGEVAMESIGLSHWWKNTSKQPVVLLSADILHVERDDHNM